MRQKRNIKSETEEKRKILQECMKKTSALEKFRDQQLEDYKQELENEEKKNIEELSTIKSNSKRS